MLWVTGPVNADGPSMALSVLAIALALRALDHATPRLADAVWVGLAAGARGVDQGVVGAGGRDRRVVVLLLAPTRQRVRDAALAAGVALGGVPRHLAALGHRPGVGSVVHVPQRRAAFEHASRRARGRWSRRSGNATCSSSSRSASHWSCSSSPASPRSAACRVRAGRGMPRVGIVVAVLVLWAGSCSRSSSGNRRCSARTSPSSCHRSRCWRVSGRHRGWCSRSPQSWSRRSGRSGTTPSSGPMGTGVTRRRWSAACARCPADALVISDDPGLAWRCRARPARQLRGPVVPADRAGTDHRATIDRRRPRPRTTCAGSSSRRRSTSEASAGSGRVARAGYRAEQFGDITVFTKPECRA